MTDPTSEPAPAIFNCIEPHAPDLVRLVDGTPAVDAAALFAKVITHFDRNVRVLALELDAAGYRVSKGATYAVIAHLAGRAVRDLRQRGKVREEPPPEPQPLPDGRCSCASAQPCSAEGECSVCGGDGPRRWSEVAGEAVCSCAEIQRADPLRHFTGCARREPLPAGHPQAAPPPPATVPGGPMTFAELRQVGGLMIRRAVAGLLGEHPIPKPAAAEVATALDELAAQLDRDSDAMTRTTARSAYLDAADRVREVRCRLALE